MRKSCKISRDQSLIKRDFRASKHGGQWAKLVLALFCARKTQKRKGGCSHGYGVNTACACRSSTYRWEEILQLKSVNLCHSENKQTKTFTTYRWIDSQRWSRQFKRCPNDLKSPRLIFQNSRVSLVTFSWCDFCSHANELVKRHLCAPLSVVGSLKLTAADPY